MSEDHNSIWFVSLPGSTIAATNWDFGLLVKVVHVRYTLTSTVLYGAAADDVWQLTGEEGNSSLLKQG
jgi:hypothetical protein